MKSYFFLILLFLLFSCTDNNKKKSSSLEDSINPIIKQKLLHNDKNFESVFINKFEVELHIDEKFAIANLKDLIVKNNIFIVADDKRPQLFKFDHNGKLLSTIGRKGRGPGEYLSINSIDLNKNNELFVLDVESSKVSKFDSANNFIEFISVSADVCSILSDFESGLYLYNPVSRIKPMDIDLIKHINKKGEIINSFCKPFFEFGLVEGWLVKDTFGNLYATQMLSNIVVKYSPNGEYIGKYSSETENHNILQLENKDALPKLELLNNSTMLIGFEVCGDIIFFQFANQENSIQKSWIDIYDSNGNILNTGIITPSNYILSYIGNNKVYFVDLPVEENSSKIPNYHILEYEINESELSDENPI